MLLAPLGAPCQALGHGGHVRAPLAVLEGAIGAHAAGYVSSACEGEGGVLDPLVQLHLALHVRVLRVGVEDEQRPHEQVDHILGHPGPAQRRRRSFLLPLHRLLRLRPLALFAAMLTVELGGKHPQQAADARGLCRHIAVREQRPHRVRERHSLHVELAHVFPADGKRERVVRALDRHALDSCLAHVVNAFPVRREVVEEGGGNAGLGLDILLRLRQPQDPD
mmetsp:Transcript_50433/g.100651  ORF Transcript_50433/g.100651 Transcript_50433/m.100651 type:complete len:222 (+) Transcript_50433:347-1012(+)